MATGRFAPANPPRRLIADGNTGRLAILTGASRAAFDDPAGNMSDVLFHSELDYLRVEQEVIGTVTFPRRDAQWKTVEKKKSKWKLPVLAQGEALFPVATAVGDVDSPIAVFTLDGSQVGATAIMDDLNIGPESDGFQALVESLNSAGGKQALRTVSTFIAPDGQITVREKYLLYGAHLPEASLSLRIVKFNALTGPDPDEPFTLKLTPSQVVASQGKLNSNYRYVRKVPGGLAKFRFVYGRTMDLQNGSLVLLDPVVVDTTT
ncbi:hypothetical protein LCM08_06125 [Salipiger pacificus]|nr:hypothetical protein [Alloyangia pacifica]